MTVFITKYALTKGILGRELVTQHDEKMITVEWEGGFNGKAYFHSGDWYFTEAEAVARAEEMKVRKIAQLKKHIAALEKMEF